MKIIPYSEFSAWIRSQPDDKAVNMHEPDQRGACGCVMMQYAREHCIPCDSVGIQKFYPKGGHRAAHELDSEGGTLISKLLVAAAGASKIKNYADVKAHLHS